MYIHHLGSHKQRFTTYQRDIDSWLWIEIESEREMLIKFTAVAENIQHFENLND